MASTESPLPPLPPGKSTRASGNKAISYDADVKSDLETGLPAPPTPPPPPPPLQSSQNAKPNHQSVNLGREVKGGKDNAVYTTKYNLLTFLPIAIREQFRRNGNIYFLCMGCLMFIGYRTPLYNTAINPWTTLGPLAVVVSISLLQEGMADLKRRSSDIDTNYHPCVVLRRADDMDPKDKRVPNIMDGNDIEVKLLPSILERPQRKSQSTNTRSRKVSPASTKIAFASTNRMDIRVGEIVLVRNREMVPADIIILGSSGENGSAYVETSQIDGETNLKLRKSPRLPVNVLPRSTPKLGQIDQMEEYEHPKYETISQAVKRVTRLSLLGYPEGISVLHDPSKASSGDDAFRSPSRRPSLMEIAKSFSWKTEVVDDDPPQINRSTKFIATLTSELPNASVNTFTGKISLPSLDPESPRFDIPLNAENFLLRGAALRNTDWVIGVACFTGSDTKLVQNSVKTPSKFSRLDELMNRTVLLILFIMLVLVVGLGCLYSKNHNAKFDTLWYIGFHKETDTPWPYLADFDVPEWSTNPETVLQSILSYITLLNNFVPLSLYVTVEITTLFMMFLIGWDKNMYHKETDTCAEARSTIVSDLGQIQYIFSDKTGTLTQNVMKFKRCSVDGMMFGAPVAKASPISNEVDLEGLTEQEFHPLKKLLVGVITLDQKGESDGFSVEPGPSEIEILKSDTPVGPEPLTFNAEMFLRVMSICHTVVVEKEMDPSGIGTKKGDNDSVVSDRSLFSGMFSRRPRTLTEDSVNSAYLPIREVSNESPSDNESSCNDSISPSDNGVITSGLKSVNGAPAGYTYQAESPDEEALVSAASMEYGFQLKSRDASGLTISCESPSLLSNKTIADGLKKGSTNVKKLASQTASPRVSTVGLRSLRKTLSSFSKDDKSQSETSYLPPGDETWDILAINKFDSTRKRMSVVVRSPPELGSIPMLFCKGADSTMLDPDVCGVNNPSSLSTKSNDDNLSEGDDDDGGEWNSSSLLGIQAHLGAFASEGLRTLVLGIRILSEEECNVWCEKYERAAAALVDRDKKMTDLAFEIERNIHIVGASAIEDKLQDGVPEAINNIGKAGIKLWVLTGDKRETAIEIGYSTKVLHPTMYLTDVADASILKVRALIAMEFMRLVKMGKLAPYQTAALKKETEGSLTIMFRRISDFLHSAWRDYRRFYHKYIRRLCFGKVESDKALQEISTEEETERDAHLLRTRVRYLAQKSIDDYRKSEEAVQARKAPSIASYLSTESNGVGEVFSRAYSAMNQSSRQRNSKQELRNISIASMTSDNIKSEGIIDLDEKNIEDEKSPPGVIDEDVLSILSFAPGTGEYKSFFNKKKRNILEKMFAVDRDVRKGTLNKHLTRKKKDELKQKNNELLNGSELRNNSLTSEHETTMDGDQRRALVIEGSALAHFLGDPLYEEMLFAVASCCESVIACRVSPKQKALLVKMVQFFVKPTPVTLAIGDGANDVGMIQEAHVGVGISGLEGRQAVNASDFSIAQFRFLEELLLVHGRWNFIRLSKVILFSFYKNALLAALLISYSPKAFYSGITLFDQWCISSFNFICSWPILLLGFFDRDLDRDYVKRYPHLYAAGPANESLCLRVTLRWVFLVFLHSTIIFFFSDAILGPVGAGMSSAFKGLMSNESIHGDGEGGNLKIYGTVIFVTLTWVLALKVLFESSSIIHGVWPAFTCRKNVGEGFWNRVAYTWHGVIFLSIAFSFFFLYVYQTIGRSAVADGFNSMAAFVSVTWHMFHTRSITWMVLLLTPISAMVADVVLKLFSNTFYPTQTHIHKEMQWIERQNSKMRSETYLEPSNSKTLT